MSNLAVLPVFPIAEPSQGGEVIRLPSGWSIQVSIGENEDLEVRGPDGMDGLTISITPAGAVVKIKKARLEMEVAEGLDLNVGDFNVTATNAIHMRGPQVSIESTKTTCTAEELLVLQSALITLN